MPFFIVLTVVANHNHKRLEHSLMLAKVKKSEFKKNSNRHTVADGNSTD